MTLVPWQAGHIPARAHYRAQQRPASGRTARARVIRGPFLRRALVVRPLCVFQFLNLHLQLFQLMVAVVVFAAPRIRGRRWLPAFRYSLIPLPGLLLDLRIVVPAVHRHPDRLRRCPRARIPLAIERRAARIAQLLGKAGNCRGWRGGIIRGSYRRNRFLNKHDWPVGVVKEIRLVRLIPSVSSNERPVKA